MMTEIYELQAWSNNEYRNIHTSDLEQDIKEAIIKVGYEPHEGHSNNYYIKANENGIQIEFEMVEGGHKTTALYDMCYNSLARLVLEQGKNIERTHIG
jgi:glutathionylspermidine synthase